MEQSNAPALRRRGADRRGSSPWPWLWMLAGTCALLLGGLGAAQYRLALARAPLLHHPSGLVVDDSGRIYCGVASGRIHVYDTDGRIVRVWPVESDGGPFRLRLAAAAPAALEVATQRGGRLVTYDGMGEIVSQVEDPGAFERFGEVNDLSFSTPDGVRYAFEGSALMRRDAGTARIVVSPIPIPLRWFAGVPWLLLAVFLLGPIGIFGGLIQQGRGLSSRARGSSAPRDGEVHS